MAPSDPPTTRKNSEVVTQGFLSAELAKLASTNQSATAAQTLVITENIRAIFESRIIKVEEKVESVAFDLNELRDSTRKELDDLKSEIRLIKMNNIYHMCKDNTTSQRLRKNTVRLHNCKVKATTGVETMNEVWNSIFLPAFNAALAEGEIDFIPSRPAVIEHGHKLTREDSALIPAINVSISSRNYMHVLLKHVRELFKDPPTVDGVTEGESTPAVRKRRISKDLTPQNRSVMTRCYNDPSIDKVKLAGETLMFTFKSSPNHWRTILNVYAETFADMQIAPTRPENPLLQD